MSFGLKDSGSQSGQSVIEMSLMFLVFALMFFAVLEYSHYFYARLTVRHALREAVRYASTGQADIPDPQDPGETLARPAAIRAVFDKYLKGFSAANLQEFTITPADGGSGREMASVTVRFNKPFFTRLIGKLLPVVAGCPANHICFQMNAVWMNEPSVP